MSFWEDKALSEMTHTEWESLCDNCALCCRLKNEDDDGNVEYTPVACRLLDVESCRCRDYANRRALVPDCLSLTPDNVAKLGWLPTSCAYRLLSEGHPLPDWHPLVTGNPESAHDEGFSLRDRVISETELHPPV